MRTNIQIIALAIVACVALAISSSSGLRVESASSVAALGIGSAIGSLVLFFKHRTRLLVLLACLAVIATGITFAIYGLLNFPSDSIPTLATVLIYILGMVFLMVMLSLAVALVMGYFDKKHYCTEFLHGLVKKVAGE